MYNFTYYIETKDGYEIEVSLDYNISGEDGTELTTYNEKIVAICDENGFPLSAAFVANYRLAIIEFLNTEEIVNKLEAELWEDYDKHLDDMAS